ncbi:MAG: glutamate-1-semialdehyde 2,1-aminomutase [Verrucomicrobia bacterium]|nr:glutamate-1-semialdehyde 2,1-aminomutase [Verrucomicrobiota bacterium]MDA1085671.1 glutamate-1-semialdehyde 2,1-aminomutase [Verrucomicrobiota bacterium]
MSRSADLFEASQRVIPGGVNSPVRAFASVGGDPIFIASAEGSRIRDVDGNEYIDCVSSWGPMILGHAHPEVIDAVRVAALRGTSYGAPTEGELHLAELIVQLVPSIEKVRLVSSGTEAAMSALRLARGVTGRDAVIKFEGCYHGHADSFLIKAGSGATTLGNPSSPGVPDSLAAHTLNATYNDLESVERAFEEAAGDVACIIVEPVAGNMGVIPPEAGFLEGLRSLADSNGALLIFDEVITGFRCSLGGAQALYGVTPDLTTLGKILGGGLPVGAFGGRADLMDQMAPLGPVYQAGTLSGNPLAVAGGLKTLEILLRDDPYKELAAESDRLFGALMEGATLHGEPLQANWIASMGCCFFASEPIRDYRSASTSDTVRFAAFHSGMLEKGVYLAPSQFEATFLSAAHTTEDVDTIIAAAQSMFA